MANYQSFKKIDRDALVANALTNAEFANGSVDTTNFANNSVTTEQIQDGAVTSAKLANTINLSGKTVTYRPIATSDINNSANIAGSKLGAGAASTNLGYTPLNRAGGTMSGQLRLPAGNAASPSLTTTGDTNTGVYWNGTETVFVAGGTEALRIVGAGQVTKPNTVMFHATGTTGWRYNNQYSNGTGWREVYQGMGWSTYQRGGTNFNTTNGRFTAPVAGFYQFQFETYARNDTNLTSGYFHLSFGRNGSRQMHGSRVPHGIFGHGTFNTVVQGVRMDLATYMNAGQYISLWAYNASNNTRWHGAHSFFNGFLVS